MKKISVLIISSIAVFTPLSTRHFFPPKTVMNHSTKSSGNKDKELTQSPSGNWESKLKTKIEIIKGHPQNLNGESPPISKLSVKPSKSPLFTQKEITKLSKVLTKSTNFINPIRAYLEFRSSGADSLSNYGRVEKILKKPYPKAKMDRFFLQQRIVALHFLKYSRFLSLADCTSHLSDLSNQWDSSNLEETKMNIAFDVSHFTQICSEKFSNSFLRWILKQRLPEQIRFQIAHYLRKTRGLSFDNLTTENITLFEERDL